MATNLQLQGGAIYLEEYNTDGTLQDKIYPGTTDELSFSTELETIEHYDTEEEEQVLDGEDVVKRTITLKFTTADVNDTFNTMAYLASSTALTQTVKTAVAVTLADVALGSVLDIGIIDITELVVKDSTDAITYTLGTDYTYDRKWGTFIALATGTIVSMSDLNLTVTANAVSGKTLTSFQVDKKEYRLTYQGRSSKGRNEKHIFEKVSIAMDGDRILKSGSEKEYTTISFAGSVLKHNGVMHSMQTY